MQQFIDAGRGERLTAGLLFLGSTILMLVSWTGLMTDFEYPLILRQAPSVVLMKFLAGGDSLRLLWTGMTLSSVLLTFAILAVRRQLVGPKTGFLVMGTVFGVLSGFVQTLGLIRWVLVVPAVASGWSSADPQQKLVWEALFTVVNQYGGVAIGEVLGYLFTGLWLVFLGAAILRSGTFHKISGWLAIVTGVGISSGILEHAGLGWAVAVNASSYMLLMVLFLYFGGWLIYRSIVRVPETD